MGTGRSTTICRRPGAGGTRAFRYPPPVVAPRPRRVSGRVLTAAVMTLGIAVGALGVWWMSRSRPSAGDYVDVLALGGDAAVVVRHERGGTRSFVDLIDGGAARWSALVPRYADPPAGVGLSASAEAVTVRVVRGGLPEVFALSARDAAKLGGIHLAAERAPHPTGYTVPRVTTVMAGTDSVEVIGDDPAWAELIAIRSGKPAWRQALGAGRVERVAIEGDRVLVWRDGAALRLDRSTGAPLDSEPATALPPPVIAAGDVTIEIDGERVATASTAGAPVARIRWPAAARLPQAHNAADGALWMVLPDRVVLLEPRTLAPITSIGGPAPAIEPLPLR